MPPYPFESIAMASWADASDMVLRYDVRSLSNLISDSGSRDTDFANNSRLTALLSTSTGYMKSQFLRSKMYTTAQLDALTGESLELRKDICCSLTWWYLWRSKPWLEHTSEAQRASKEDAEAYMELLKSGGAIFDIDSTVEAGIPKVTAVPSRTVTTNWELFKDRATGAGRLYPRRRSFRRQ